MNFHQERIQRLNDILAGLRKAGLNDKTPALADRIANAMRQFGYGPFTQKNYVGLLVDALIWEGKHPGQEFKFTQ